VGIAARFEGKFFGRANIFLCDKKKMPETEVVLCAQRINVHAFLTQLTTLSTKE
jgi:hypothetical protein